MQKYQFVSINTILAKFKRDFKGINVEETDMIDWISEALGFMQTESASEEAIVFLEVKDYHAELPLGLHYVIQIARNKQWQGGKTTNSCINLSMKEVEACNSEESPETNNCKVDFSFMDFENMAEVADYFDDSPARPKPSLKCNFSNWSRFQRKQDKYSLVRLSNHSFFNSVVCNFENYDELYSSCRDEYTIVQDRLRFNFKDGLIALSYVRQMVDEETGYPMIPDHESAKAALTYYVGWKVNEVECWNHREGACQLAERAEAKWLKYVGQFNAQSKMPMGIDDYEDLKQQSKYLMPRNNAYYGYFGNLNTNEHRGFLDPNNTNRRSR